MQHEQILQELIIHPEVFKAGIDDPTLGILMDFILAHSGEFLVRDVAGRWQSEILKLLRSDIRIKYYLNGFSVTECDVGDANDGWETLIRLSVNKKQPNTILSNRECGFGFELPQKFIRNQLKAHRVSFRIQKEIEKFKRLFEPLFHYSRWLTFIDPYLWELKDSHASFIDLLDAVPAKTPKIVLEVHCGLDNRTLSQVREKADAGNLPVLKMLKEWFRQNWSPTLRRAGHTVKVTVWDCRRKEDKMHDRFLLSDLGGFSLAQGFACKDPMKTTICRLTRDDVEDIEKEYHENSANRPFFAKFDLP